MQGVAGNLSIAQVDAEKLPFATSSFDCITIAFGLRNVTEKETALASMLRVLKPGGKLLILEFSKPSAAIKPAYDLYSFKILPMLGKLVANDESSYQYLAESIRMHPDQERTHRHDARRRLRALPLSQPGGRYCRPARRIQNLNESA